MCEIPGTDGFLLLAVFDGHGGKGAAIFAEAHLLEVLHNTSESMVLSHIYTYLIFKIMFAALHL
jgi:serine/threonine protein phosphatase PrpC